MSTKIEPQTYADGVVRIYDVSNAAAAGNKPVDVLTPKVSLRYAERTVGISRYYAALQADVRISRLLRCPLLRSVSTQDAAIPNDGKRYRIEQIQYPEDVVPPVMDMSLVEVSQVYKVAEAENV
jgi:hypothetical protein